MSKNERPLGEIVILTDAVLITAIVQRGVADEVVKVAQAAGAQGATIYYARGTGVRQRHMGLLGITVNAEKEVVLIVASTEQADRIFERVYKKAQLDTPGMGMIYTTPIEKMATYVPPEVIEKVMESSA